MHPTKPLLEHVVRANRARFSWKMYNIIKLANNENEKIIAEHILMHSNGKPRSSDHSKWEKLKNELPDFTADAYRMYQKKYPIKFYPTLEKTVINNRKNISPQIPKAISYVCENYINLKS